MQTNKISFKSGVLILILVFLVSFQSSAQHLEVFNQAMQQFNSGRFDKAITQLKETVNINNNFQDGWYYLGMAFVYTKQYPEAIYSFQRLEGINNKYNPWFYYETCQAFIELGKFNEAEIAIRKYLEYSPKGAKTTHFEHMAKNRLEYALKSQLLREQPETMGAPDPLESVNSISGDYTPQVSPTGTRLYFTSVRKGGFDRMDDSTRVNHWGEDVYFSDLDSISNQWSEPSLLPPPINSINDDFGSAFTGDGQMMVYVRCGDKQGVGNCDLYITQLVGTEWSEPVNMGNIVNSEEWDSQPTISSDGNRIIFTSSRKGGYGGSDIYMTEKNHLGDWGIPQNLGGTVNTPFNDNSPYLAPDGKTLYYASNGHPGFGGTDIFYCIFDNGKWSKPINLGAPLNSGGDDTNFSISASGMAYFASSRIDPDNYEIFQVELPDELKPKPTVVIQGVVSNSRTTEPIGALVLIEDINTGELIAINKSNTSSGEYLIVLPAGRNYSVSANSKGFFFYSQSFEIPKDTSYQEITMDIALEPIEKGTKVVLNNIFFESGRAELKPISYVELNKAVDLLESNASMVIEIGGHTDDVGSDELNLKLSQDRAAAVMDYLVLAGIEATRLQAKGYGETQPIAENTDEAGRSKNRRTEFEIIAY